MALRIDVLTIFPGMFDSILSETILARARRAGLVEVCLTDLRDFTADRHRSVDDRPYGGGPGMVFKPEPVFKAVDAVLALGKAPPERTRKILLSPQGSRLVQDDLWGYSHAEWILLLCGRYEGFDQRIHEGLGFEEVSIGDYVLSGGEVPAMVLIEGVVRLIPGALGDAESPLRESFEDGRLEGPQYTRPPEFRGMKVPEILVSGHHGQIARWREEQALKRTLERRVDLLGGVPRAVPQERDPRGESVSNHRPAADLRRPSGAEEGEAACRGRRGGGSASPAIRGAQSLSKNCSGSVPSGIGKTGDSDHEVH